MRRELLAVTMAVASLASGQRVEVRDAPELVMPSQVDCNSPAFWNKGEMFLFNSTGAGPVRSRGGDQTQLMVDRYVTIRGARVGPRWIEAVWKDPAGPLFGWYHEEHENVCGAQRPAQPHIGAIVSYDGGATFDDLGSILVSGDPIVCSAKNGYTSGGHGDFSVVLDRESSYFYFLFSNYGGPDASQGVAVARMAFADRFRPANRVWKYFDGKWESPGQGGPLTPIFPAVTNWQVAETDSFWGPSVHFNTYLDTYVMLLNRSCCSSGYPQEGIYISFNPDPANPAGWTAPEKIVDGTWWYPQVLGTGPDETDSLAGENARLYVYGSSRWELIFHRDADVVPEEPTPMPTDPVVPPDPDTLPDPDNPPGPDTPPEPDSPTGPDAPPEPDIPPDSPAAQR